MRRKKPKYYFCKTWLMNFDFFIDWTWEEFDKYCLKNYGFELVPYSGQAGYTTLITKGKAARVLIWIENKEDIPTVAHEALHGVNFTLDRAGYKFDISNDESQAYFLSEIIVAMGFK